MSIDRDTVWSVGEIPLSMARLENHIVASIPVGRGALGPLSPEARE